MCALFTVNGFSCRIKGAKTSINARNVYENSPMDTSDKKILHILQSSAELSNAVIGERIGLSASQVSRRRQRLEDTGVIKSYQAVLDANALGFTLDALIRIKLATHSEQSALEFRTFVQSLDEIRLACAITGDADYLLHARVADLSGLSSLINRQLLPNKLVAEVRSEVVLDLIKDNSALPVL